MRANFNKCLCGKFNYHSTKNLHFSIKIFLIINVILTETIHNHFIMSRRKLEQQNKVNYTTQRHAVKLCLFFHFSVTCILQKILLYNKATKIFAMSMLTDEPDGNTLFSQKNKNKGSRQCKCTT